MPLPRPRAFGLGLVSVLVTWPRECAIQCKTILVVSILWLCHCNIHYKDVVKQSNVRRKFSYVLLSLSPCVLILKYLHVAGLDFECWNRPYSFPRLFVPWNIRSLDHSFPRPNITRKIHSLDDSRSKTSFIVYVK